MHMEDNSLLSLEEQEAGEKCFSQVIAMFCYLSTKYTVVLKNWVGKENTFEAGQQVSHLVTPSRWLVKLLASDYQRWYNKWE